MLKVSSQRGFYLIEAIVVMSVAVSLMSLGARYITTNAEHSVNQVTAQQLKQVTSAAQQYVQDHYQEFNNNSNPRLEWQTLVDQGYLPDTVPNHNHYGQAYQFEVKSANRQLQLILTTQKGQPISESSLRQIAALAGSSAGYATTLHKNKIVGNQEGWFLEGFPLTTGHLASLSIVNEKEIMDAANFLRRTKFKDHEEYNQMETDLLMGENTIQLVKNNKTVELNTDGVVFSDNKRKSIGIFNSYYPHIIIQDDTLTIPNTMWLNSADLKFEKGEHSIHIGVDEPGLSISSQASVTKVTSDSISVSNHRGSRVELNLEGLTVKGADLTGYQNGFFSRITKNFIKIPSVKSSNADPWDIVYKMECHSDDSDGAMFLLERMLGIFIIKELSICSGGQAIVIKSWS